MITLTISSSLPQFTQFLLECCGIEGNILTVDEARAAARHSTCPSQPKLGASATTASILLCEMGITAHREE